MISGGREALLLDPAGSLAGRLPATASGIESRSKRAEAVPDVVGAAAAADAFLPFILGGLVTQAAVGIWWQHRAKPRQGT